ncbi:MAG: helix-turn-helix domain-containing protein [Elusimicrobiales bacterium]|nr:helix-turn-helix domain-containing protein [Elusimicrobiales bacterium]
MLNIGIKIKNLRQKNGMKLSDLAKATGLSVSMISQLERNIIMPSISTILSLSEIFGVKPSYFLEEERPNELLVKKSNNGEFINELLSPSDGIPIYFYKITLNENENKKILLKKTLNYSFICYVIYGKIFFKALRKTYELLEGDLLYLRKSVVEFEINSIIISKLVIFIFKDNNV